MFVSLAYAATLVASGVFTFAELRKADAFVDSQYALVFGGGDDDAGGGGGGGGGGSGGDRADETRRADLKATTHVLLLVEGALELARVGRALDSAVGARLRAMLLRDALAASAHERHERRLTRVDRAIVAWALWTGVMHICVNGTFALMNVIVPTSASNNGLIVAAWRFWGQQVDRRYIESDPFVAASDAVQAVLLGPLGLLYGWATFHRRPYRHVLGIIECTIIAYTTVLYFATEIHTNFAHVNDSNPVSLWLGFVVFNILFRMVIPIGLVAREWRQIARNTHKAERADRRWVRRAEDLRGRVMGRARGRRGSRRDVDGEQVTAAIELTAAGPDLSKVQIGVAHGIGEKATRARRHRARCIHPRAAARARAAATPAPSPRRRICDDGRRRPRSGRPSRARRVARPARGASTRGPGLGSTGCMKSAGSARRRRPMPQ